jgi:hypothetical protein
VSSSISSSASWHPPCEIERYPEFKEDLDAREASSSSTAGSRFEFVGCNRIPKSLPTCPFHCTGKMFDAFGLGVELLRPVHRVDRGDHAAEAFSKV